MNSGCMATRISPFGRPGSASCALAQPAEIAASNSRACRFAAGGRFILVLISFSFIDLDPERRSQRPDHLHMADAGLLEHRPALHEAGAGVEVGGGQLRMQHRLAV